MVSIPNDPFILVDGSSYLYRAFYAPPHLTNSAGEPTGAVYGVVNMLKSLLSQFNPSHIVVVFDAKGKSFRNDLYSEYKAHRPSMPDELRSQIEPLHKVIKAMGLPILIVPGVEADDVIGTLSRSASKQGISTLISTGDKDMAQLVDEHTLLINTMTNTVLDVEGVKDKFGVPPELIIDFLGLMGDKSDNIPGVAGVGEKTALAMLQGIGSVTDIYNNLEKLPELGFRGCKTISKKMIEHKELALLSYKLATIKTDVPLDVSYEDFINEDQDTDELVQLFGQLEFKRWLSALLDGGNISPNYDPSANSASTPMQSQKETEEKKSSLISIKPLNINRDLYETIYTDEQLSNWMEKLKEADLFAIDTETTSINHVEASIVGISFAVQKRTKKGEEIEVEAAYLPLAHNYIDAPEQLHLTETLKKLQPLLEDPAYKKVGQNLKYDRSVFLNHGITLEGIAFDTMLEAYVLDSTGKHGMDALALKYLNHKCISFTDVAGKGKKQLTFDKIEINEAAPYAAEDADITLRLHIYLNEKLSTSTKQLEILEKIELPLLKVLCDIERCGVEIDSDLLNAQSNELSKRLLELEEEGYTLAGKTFNLGSPKQLAEVLFTDLELPVIKKSKKTGVPSTGEEVLQTLCDQGYELPKLILEYRGLSKLKSTYTDKLPLMVNEQTKRVHTSYNQAATVTGRLSSSEPNLQNVPVRTAEGRRIRQAFIAKKGYKIVAVDYSQVELRILAHLSQDQGLLEAFRSNTDVHSATAAEIFAVKLDDVTSSQRRSAKAINFGLIYGMSAFGLAKQLKIGRQDAQEYIKRYFARYPRVSIYMEEIKASAQSKGYVETQFGRKLLTPDINSKNGIVKKAAERAAINAPMQGTAADIIKLAMIKISDWLKTKEQGTVEMLMQVHDELVFNIKEEFVEQYGSEIQTIMQDAADLDVPLIADLGIGDNWDEAH